MLKKKRIPEVPLQNPLRFFRLEKAYTGCSLQIACISRAKCLFSILTNKKHYANFLLIPIQNLIIIRNSLLLLQKNSNQH